MSLASLILQHPVLSHHQRLKLYPPSNILLVIDASMEADSWTLDPPVLEGVEGTWVVFNDRLRDQGLLPHLPTSYEHQEKFHLQTFFDQLNAQPSMIVLLSDGLISWPETAPCPMLWVNTFIKTFHPPSYVFEISLKDV